MTMDGQLENISPDVRYNTTRSLHDRQSLVTPQRVILKTRMDQIPDFSPAAPPGSSHPILHAGNSNGVSQRRPRPETSHQKAVNINRKMRIDHILHKQILTEHSIIRKRKRDESSSFGFTAMKRIKDLLDEYDTEDERAWGPGGLLPNPDEAEDYGAEALRQKKSIDRAVRRLVREETGAPVEGLVKGYRRRKRKLRGYADDEDNPERTSRKRRKYSATRRMQMERSREGERREEGLDDLDLDLLGESRDDDQMTDEDSGMEDSEGEDLSEDDQTVED